MAVIGAGTRGRFQIAAVNEVVKISNAKIYDIVPRVAADYVREMTTQHGLEIKQGGSREQAVEGADIVITATPSTGPIVLNEWIKEGAHINAIGADAPANKTSIPQ